MKHIGFIITILFVLSCANKTYHVENTNQEVFNTENNQSKTDEIQETVFKSKVETDTIIKPRQISGIPLNTASGYAVVDHTMWTNLLKKHVSNEGNVNYKGFIEDQTKFNSYLEVLSQIPPQDAWSKDRTLAYWLNVYNAFTVKLITDHYPTKSIKDINGQWSTDFINIGNELYSLNDIEHRIIRKMGEPRIHFALVCAAVSCPRLYNKAFTEEELESDLELLTKGFLSDTSKNELSENHMKLSKIFKWYGSDFEDNDQTLIDFLNQYSDVKISAQAKKSYKDYNWSLNE